VAELGQRDLEQVSVVRFDEGELETEPSATTPALYSTVTCNLVYKVKLKPKCFSIKVKDKDIPLAPGMAMTAEIETGERRVIEFFISPFIKYVGELLTLR
jgi:hemolysin D